MQSISYSIDGMTITFYPSIEIFGVYRCGGCGALVEGPQAYAHTVWHEVLRKGLTHEGS